MGGRSEPFGARPDPSGVLRGGGSAHSPYVAFPPCPVMVLALQLAVPLTLLALLLCAMYASSATDRLP